MPHIHDAAAAGDARKVQRCLKGFFGPRSEDINAADDDDRTPLHHASASGHTEVVTLLTDRGADLHARDSNGCTPLHLAAAAGQLEVAKLLLDRGADLCATDGGNNRPSSLAWAGGHAETAEFLEEAQDQALHDGYWRQLEQRHGPRQDDRREAEERREKVRAEMETEQRQRQRRARVNEVVGRILGGGFIGVCLGFVIAAPFSGLVLAMLPKADVGALFFGLWIAGGLAAAVCMDRLMWKLKHPSYTPTGVASSGKPSSPALGPADLAALGSATFTSMCAGSLDAAHRGIVLVRVSDAQTNAAAVGLALEPAAVATAASAALMAFQGYIPDERMANDAARMQDRATTVIKLDSARVVVLDCPPDWNVPVYCVFFT